jgi:hypothetical protein
MAWILIAGPYRTGAADADARATNLRALNRAALAVLRKGHTPVVGVNLVLPIAQEAPPAEYEAIVDPVSLEIAERCDAVLRIGGPSACADLEVERVRQRGGAVFRDVEEIPPTASAAANAP